MFSKYFICEFRLYVASSQAFPKPTIPYNHINLKNNKFKSLYNYKSDKNYVYSTVSKLNSINKEDNILKGKELVDKYCKAKGIVLSDVLKPEYTEKVLKKYSFRDWDSILASIGHGGLKEGQIVNKLVEEYEKKNPKKISDEDILDEISSGSGKKYQSGVKGGIIVKGVHDVSVRYSKCCNPVPGDEIVGFVTRGRGISIHRTDCVNIMALPEIERARLIEADWQHDETDDKAGEKYLAEIQIFANNRTGLLADIYVPKA